MSDKSRSDQAGIITFGRAVASLADGVLLLVIVRLLGKADVGVFGGLLLTYQTIALVSTSGFPGAILYFLPTLSVEQRRAAARTFATTMLGLGLLASVVLLGAAAMDAARPDLMAGFLEESLAGRQTRSLLLLALMPIGDIPVRMLPNLLIVEQRVKASAGVGVIKTLGNTISTVVPLALGAELWVAIAAIVAFGLLYSLLLPLYLRRIYYDVPRVPSPLSSWELLRFAFPMGLTDIMGVLNQRVDRYIVIALWSASAFAEYQAGAWQIPFVVTIPYAVGQVYAPHYRRLFDAGEMRQAIDTWRLAVLKVSLLVVPSSLLFVVAAEETVVLLFTDEYVNAASVFRWYSVLTLGRVAVFGAVIVAAGRPDLLLMAAAGYLGLNVVISLPLAWTIGFVGPAMGTAFAFVGGAWIYCVCIAKATGEPVTRTLPVVGYTKIVLAAGPGVVVALGLKSWLTWGPASMLAIEAVAVLGGFALVATVTRVVDREDWRYVAKWLRLDMLR